MTRPLLLVISTGPRRFREYLFESMSTRYRIHLLNTVEPTWEKAYLDGATVVPSTDVDVLLEAARAVAATTPVDGVMSWDEARIHQAAVVARDLGLPTTDPEAVWRCRDKHATRTALAGANVPQPRFALVGTVDKALAAAAEIGYPVVVKPRAAAASYGVILVRTPEELATHFAFSAEATVPHAPTYDESVLVEEYLDAPEISIDSVVVEGRAQALFVARKQLAYAPYFEEVGHVVTHHDPLLRDPEVARLLQDTHSALGFTDGWTHAEFKVTPNGLKVIEVNGRLGGDLIPYLGMRASGIDPGLIAAAVACGTRPEIAVDRELVGSVRFFYVEEDSTVIDVVEFDRAALPAHIDSAVVLAVPGSVVSPPPKGINSGRIAFATAVAPGEPECAAALDAARAALVVTSR
ncbi:ATP-grasp domain-containing protein [Actinosynnema sp. NPDC020468]|uniref:ATP-grasp domain-containing protein n=1 Tax=Actinosynnema sp. NPDC020468 TaxID=3154488 RepID=UPI0033DBEC39